MDVHKTYDINKVPLEFFCRTVAFPKDLKLSRAVVIIELDPKTGDVRPLYCIKRTTHSEITT